MQAYIVEEPGGEFHRVELRRPTLKPNHVLVKIQASGINPLDTKIRAGKAGHAQQPLPAVLGLDMAGIVEEVAPNITTFKPGDEVYGNGRRGRGLAGNDRRVRRCRRRLAHHKPVSFSMRQQRPCR